jgi:hypothetical protein
MEDIRPSTVENGRHSTIGSQEVAIDRWVGGYQAPSCSKQLLNSYTVCVLDVEGQQPHPERRFLCALFSAKTEVEGPFVLPLSVYMQARFAIDNDHNLPIEFPHF